jgi:hypothetical protein
VTATGVLGQSAVDGSTFRRALGLRSTFLTIGVLALDRPTAPVIYGTRVRLTGRVRGLGGTVLEQRPFGSSLWQPAPSLAANADGSFAALVGPLQATDYRLRSGAVNGQAVLFAVTASASAAPLADGSGLSGRVRPVVPGASVDVQRAVGAGWSSGVPATTDSAGRFTAAVGPGRYRIRYAPGGGVAAGISPVVQVG